MAWGAITTPSDYTVGDLLPAADVNDYVLDMIAQLWANDQVMGGNGTTAPTGDLTNHETRILAVEAITVGTIVAKTGNYTILDNDGYGTILCDPRTGAFTVTLPTAAANTNRILRFIVSYAGGAVTIDGEGAETIQAGPNSMASIVLQSQGDKLMVVCNGTGWYVLDLCTTLDTGWMNRTDVSNVHIGNSTVTYDNLTGAFTVGEKVIEYTDAGRTTPSGVYGWILSDSGTGLVLKNVAGIGVFTNNLYLKGETSAATADVDGNTKNQDSDVTHNFGVSITDTITELWYYAGTTGTNATAKIVHDVYLDSGVNRGYHQWGIDANSIRLQVGSNGLTGLIDDGTYVNLDTLDYAYKVISKWVI